MIPEMSFMAWRTRMPTSRWVRWAWSLLLMVPFGLVPFTNTLPALALLLYAIGFIQRDGGAILLGHLANIGTIVYFSVLIGGGGVAARELFQRLTG